MNSNRFSDSDGDRGNRMPVLFISHGAGPLPLLGHPTHDPMLDACVDLRAELPVPAAVLLISAHWESETISVTGAGSPGLLYDYYGFPRESYQITYQAPGDPDLAREIRERLSSAGFVATLDTDRDFDHGMFVPMKLLFPEATVPVVQVSLKGSLDAVTHLRMGRALEGLRNSGVMIIGSGLSFHNMQLFQRDATPPSKSAVAASLDFHKWLDDTLTSDDLDEDGRSAAMSNWDNAPSARVCHPREEHLLPLHVCVGAARTQATQVMRFQLLGFDARCYVWSGDSTSQA
jgi:aromatic ring-opening dioxygenase catalytic subunit (LigB family)